LRNYFGIWKRLALNGALKYADERLVVDLVGSLKIWFRQESLEISHVFRDNSTETPLYEEFQYNTDFPERLRNKSIVSNPELSPNFGISHGEFYYCRSINFFGRRDT